jgi:hypothetical protein
VSAPPRSILRLLALGQGSVEIDEKSDEDLSAVVLRPGIGSANMRVQRYPLRLVRARKLERECSVQLPVSRLPELSIKRMRCQPRHRDPSARQTALNLDNVGLCQAVEHHGEVNHRSRSRPLLGHCRRWYPAVELNATARGDSRTLARRSAQADRTCIRGSLRCTGELNSENFLLARRVAKLLCCSADRDHVAASAWVREISCL